MPNTTNITAAASNNATRAPLQGGIFEGENPSVYSTAQPINTLIIQAGIIIIFCRLLHFPLAKLRQPRVIAEVLGGVLLGPSVMGRVPGFTAAIFPTASIPTLAAAANVGLILFLFLVGLETDFRFLASNWKVALSVGTLGMILPFALGAGISVGIYNTFNHEAGLKPVNFGLFVLFVGIAMAITAFPVLCRILTELKLLRTSVGIVVLSAGVGNDIVGWCLLALCVALMNAASGLAALWIILVGIGYTLFLYFLVRPAFVWLLRRTGAFQNGPSQGIIALTVLMVLTSAFFTSIIGIHPMFGGFLIGLICPHEGGFAVKVTEKIEDLVTVLFLPLYFALSGLNTNLGLLDNGITWAYVVGIICVAFFGKITGGTLAARANGLVWRESLAIGTLMSCKGLVELIVLNIGLQAKILSTRTFTMFVVMALVTTFATTPLVSWLYPHWYQVKIEQWKRGEIDWETGALLDRPEDSSDESIAGKQKSEIYKVLAYLRMDTLPGMLTLVSLLARPAQQQEVVHHPGKTTNEKQAETASVKAGSAIVPNRALRLHGVRLSAVTERDSSILRVTEFEEDSQRDPVLNTVTAFGQAKSLIVSGTALHGPEAGFAQSIIDKTATVNSQLMLLPWSESGAMSEELPEVTGTVNDRFANGLFSSFIAQTAVATQNNATAVFVSNSFGTRKPPSRQPIDRRMGSIVECSDLQTIYPTWRKGHHIFLPFFGSEDDKIALRLVLQMAQDPTVTATIVYFETPASGKSDAQVETREVGRHSTAGSSSSDGEIYTKSVLPRADYASYFAVVRDSLPADLQDRVVFKTYQSTSLVENTIEVTLQEISAAPKNAGDLVVMGRNESFGLETDEGILGTDAKKALGDIAGTLISSVKTSLLVVRARTS